MTGAVSADGETEVAFTTLDARTIEELQAFGSVREVEPGEVLYRAGEPPPDFFVILSGEVEIVREDDTGDVVVATHTAGRFLGELNLLTGQRVYLTARVSKAGRVLVIDIETFRRLMSTKPELSDTVFRVFVARREFLRSGEGAGAIRIIGSRYSPEAMALRAFANRSRLAHTWVDLETIDDPPVYLAGIGVRPRDVPVVITPTAVLRRPDAGRVRSKSRAHLPRHPGLRQRSRRRRNRTGRSRGRGVRRIGRTRTVSLDAVAVGGQAGASSRIENYVGFPNGVSGDDLVARAAIQAMRLGARLNAPCEVAGLRVDEGFHVVVLADGSEISTRAVIIASGARYRRLEVDDLERFEGAGVYYAATDLEARACRGSGVVVVGGGNSAGQAAIYLAQQGSPVSLVVRRRALAETMSQYLIARIEANAHIEVLQHTEVRGLAGSEPPRGGHARGQPRRPTRRRFRARACSASSARFPRPRGSTVCVALDRSGFVITDRSLPEAAANDSAFGGRDPLPLETSVPGVFAVGDVRSGSLKRVASAVGEGSTAVRSVHDYLAIHT